MMIDSVFLEYMVALNKSVCVMPCIVLQSYIAVGNRQLYMRLQTHIQQLHVRTLNNSNSILSLFSPIFITSYTLHIGSIVFWTARDIESQYITVLRVTQIPLKTINFTNCRSIYSPALKRNFDNLTSELSSLIIPARSVQWGGYYSCRKNYNNMYKFIFICACVKRNLSRVTYRA